MLIKSHQIPHYSPKKLPLKSYYTLDELSSKQITQYQQAIPLAFPEVIIRSKHIATYWPKLEEYFPESQLYLLDEDKNVIAFMNTIPFFWDNALDALPDQGWDWMLQKGIEDYENKIKPNTLGGLQVIVPKEHQKKGYSRKMIAAAKKLVAEMNYKRCVIPIRPILKHLEPETKMTTYMHLQKQNKTYDPWIRTHLSSGAKILKVCSQSMKVYGDVQFWNELSKEKIQKSGQYKISGALNLIDINVENDYGEYLEENIWIAYD